MKTRQGFVSNSSSSSFIVGFEKRPQSVAEMKELLFKDQESITYWENAIDTEILAARVFQDLQAQTTPLTPEQFITYLEDDDFWKGKPDPDDFKKTESKAKAGWVNDWEAYHEANRKATEARYLKKYRKYERKLEFYHFKYCDNDGSIEGALEHGEVFENLVHIQISMH